MSASSVILASVIGLGAAHLFAAGMIAPMLVAFRPARFVRAIMTLLAFAAVGAMLLYGWTEGNGTP